MRIARRYVVSGRVQGVGYRYFALDAARRENLHGYVTNNDDGTVEAVAEGEPHRSSVLNSRCGEDRRSRASSRWWWTRSSRG